MATSEALTAVLAEVGPRLKRVRTEGHVTLPELAVASAIPKSTLSRLESGQRKPSLELLLPIAHAQRVTTTGVTNPGHCSARPVPGGG